MDLLETTMKIVENQNVMQTSLTFFKNDLEQYEEWINKLNESLEEAQTLNSQNKEILEINNFTKNTFNENGKTVKYLFGQVYNCIQEVQEKLSSILDQESPLEELNKDNDERYTTLETKYNHHLKILEIMRINSLEKLTEEKSDMKLKETNDEYMDMENSWKNVIDEEDEKNESLQSIKLEMETINDYIEEQEEEEELYLKSNEENEEGQKRNLEKAINELDTIENQIAALEEDFDKISEENKGKQRIKHEMSLNYDIHKDTSQKITQECENIKKLIDEAQETFSNTLSDLTKKIELQKIPLEDSNKKLLFYENKILENDIETEKMHTKFNLLSEELQGMQSESEKNENVKKEFVGNIDKITEENENLVNESEKTRNTINEYDNDLKKKQCELQELKTTMNSKITDTRKTMETYKSQCSAKKVDLEKEMQEINSLNKDLPKSVSVLEEKLKDLNLKKNKTENEIFQNKEKSTLITIQCDLTCNEIKRFEASKQERKKFTPTPPLKRAPVMAKPLPPPCTPKRRTAKDLDSDSSVDGERLSYAEFMAKKKMIRETKKQKK